MAGQEIPIEKIAPYIRYVNDVTFTAAQNSESRIIYDHEFIFCISGEAMMKYGENEYCITRSDLFYLCPNVENRMWIRPGKDFHAHCVHFDWFFIDERLNFTAEQYYLRSQYTEEERTFIEKLKRRPAYEIADIYIPSIVREMEYEQVYPLFHELYQAFGRQDLHAKLKQRALFIQIVSAILEKQMTKRGVVKNHYRQETISSAIKYMERHYTDAVTAPLLAEQVGLSPKYFGKLFKEITGVSVRQYMLHIRMREAKKLLLETDASMETVAEKAGFHDVFYFIKLFKQQEGITPGQYHRMLRKHPSQNNAANEGA